jgi:hypothetical protein
LYATVVSKAAVGRWTAARLRASGPVNPYTNPSKVEGFRRLPTNRRGFFNNEIQSGASSDIKATITGDSIDVLSSLVSRVSGGSPELKIAAERTA